MRFWRNRGGPENVYEHCAWCGREIRYGDVSVSIAVNVERADEQEGIEVMQSDLVLVLCESCGSRLDTDRLRHALESQGPA